MLVQQVLVLSLDDVQPRMLEFESVLQNAREWLQNKVKTIDMLHTAINNTLEVPLPS